MKGLRRTCTLRGLGYLAACFYLVTWMKGLRLGLLGCINFLISDSFYLVTWMKGLRLKIERDRNQPYVYSFYLVTWMKGLRHFIQHHFLDMLYISFYLVTWMKGLRLNTHRLAFRRFISWVFTLWPEWRDYDSSQRASPCLRSYSVFTLWPEWRDYDGA